MERLVLLLHIFVFNDLLDLYQTRQIKYKKENDLSWKIKFTLGILIIFYPTLNVIIVCDYFAFSLADFLFVFITVYFCKRIYNMKWWSSIMFFLVYKNISHIINSVIYWMLVFFCIYIGRGYEGFPVETVSILGYTINAILLIILRFILRKYRDILKEKKYIISTIVVIFGVTIIYVYNFLVQYIWVYDVTFKKKIYEKMWSLMRSFWYQNTIPSLIVIVFLLIFTIGKIKETINLEKEKGIIEEKIRAQYEYYEKIKENQIRTRRLYHDLKNHLLCVNNIDDNKNSSEYMNQLKEELKRIECVYNTKNDILDIILKSKHDVCVANNIDFFADVNFEKCNFLKMIDVCSIFSNVLDNAIEACLNMDGENRKIYIRGTLVKNYFVLKCVNSKENSIKIENNKIVSSKKDKNLHGIGLKSVANSLSKYNGEFKFKDLDGEFELDIYIPIERGENSNYEKNRVM